MSIWVLKESEVVKSSEIRKEGDLIPVLHQRITTIGFVQPYPSYTFVLHLLPPTLNISDNEQPCLMISTEYQKKSGPSTPIYPLWPYNHFIPVHPASKKKYLGSLLVLVFVVVVMSYKSIICHSSS